MQEADEDNEEVVSENHSKKLPLQEADEDVVITVFTFIGFEVFAFNNPKNFILLLEVDLYAHLLVALFACC